MMKRFSVILCCLLFGSKLFSQPSGDLKHYQQLYKDADAVFINNDRSVKVNVENGKLSIYQDDFEDLILLGTNVNRYAESSVGYSDLVDLVSLDAKTLVPEKNKYRTEEARDIVTQKSLDGSIFYDDYKEKKIFFNGLQPGARRVVSSREEVKMPQLLPAFFFQSYAPCEKSTFEISVPENVTIDYKLFNVSEDAVHFSVEQKKDFKIYRWEYSNVAALTFVDDDAPGIRYFMPHIVVRVKSYTSDGKSTNVLSTPDDLYKWYYGFIRDVNQSEALRTRQIVDSLVHNSKSETDKVKRIFYWVQDNIRYVAFEAGMEGFIPRSPDSVCNKRFGDCKDMATILTTMLRQAGLPAYPAWVGTRDIPYTYEQLPSPLVDNHMICAVQLNNKFYFLDATSNHLAYDYPSSFIQGKEALIAIDSSKFKIEHVPVVEAARNAEIDSFKLTVDQRLLKGTDVKHLTGYPSQMHTYFLAGLEPDKMKKAIEGHLTVGNNKYRLDTFQVLNQFDEDRDLIINSTFHIADYVQQAGDEIYVNLNLDRGYYNDMIDTVARKLDREIENKSLQRQHYELQIPDGYSVEYLPPAKSFQNDQFSFDVKYEQEQGKLILNKTITINTLLLQQKDFSSWNAMIRELNSVYNEAIILKKKA